MQEIAAELETISETGENKGTLHKELVTLIKSTMTDQGPTLPVQQANCSHKGRNSANSCQPSGGHSK